MFARYLLLGTLLACSAPVQRPTATTTPAPDAVPLDPAVRHGVLANGLSYYVRANATPKKRVQLWLVVKAGSVLEHDDERGLAHMVEHLAFDGTRRFPKHEIQDFIERSGMRFGADLNAETSFDDTKYQLLVPTDDPATIGKGLDVLRDWSSDITFDPQASIDERKVIEEERRTRNTADARNTEQLIAVAAQGAQYAVRLPIGKSEVIKAATGDQLRAFYKRWYRPELMAVIAVGDIDPATLEHEIQQRFSDLPASPANAAPRPALTIDPDHPSRMAVARDPENALTNVEVDYQLHHRGEGTRADLEREMREAMLSQLVSSRMTQLAKRATPPWTSAGIGFSAGPGSLDELELQANVQGTDVLAAVNALGAELARMRQHGFSAEELARASADVLRRFDNAVKERDTRDSADVMGELVRNFLVAAAVPDPQWRLDLGRGYLPTITSDQLVATASFADGAHGRVVLVTAPKDGVVPGEAEVEQRFDAAMGAPIAAWQAVDLARPLLAAEPVPGKVTRVEQLSQGVTKWTLSNGAHVLLKPTTFKQNEVTIAALAPGGTSLVADADYVNAKYSAEVVNAMGFGNYSVADLQQKLAGKKVSVAARIDSTVEELDGKASPDDLESLAQLVYAAFTAPRLDRSAFDAWKAQTAQGAGALAAQAQAKFVLELLGFFYGNHPRTPRQFPTVDEVNAVDPERAMAQHAARVANAANFDFVIVGAFTADKIKPLVERYFASLPATSGKRSAVIDVGVRAKSGVLEHTSHFGTEAKAMTVLVATEPLPWSLALQSDDSVLDVVLDIEMLQALRAKLGGTYSVSVSSEISHEHPQTAVQVVFESAPERTKELQDEAWRTLDRLATTPLSDDTLGKVRAQLVKTHETSLLDNDYWLLVLASLSLYGGDLDAFLSIERKTSRVTKPEIQRIVKELVGKANRATFTLLPEK